MCLYCILDLRWLLIRLHSGPQWRNWKSIECWDALQGSSRFGHRAFQKTAGRGQWYVYILETYTIIIQSCFSRNGGRGMHVYCKYIQVPYIRYRSEIASGVLQTNCQLCMVFSSSCTMRATADPKSYDQNQVTLRAPHHPSLWISRSTVNLSHLNVRNKAQGFSTIRACRKFQLQALSLKEQMVAA